MGNLRFFTKDNEYILFLLKYIFSNFSKLKYSKYEIDISSNKLHVNPINFKLLKL